MTATTTVRVEAAAAERPLDGPVVDVSALGNHAFGRRSALFWGVLLLCCIEGMCFAMLFAAYFYVRDEFSVWPPEEKLRLLPGIVNGVVLLASALAMWKVRQAAVSEQLVPMRRWLAVTTALGFGTVGVRAWEFAALPFPWDANVYASLVWTTMGLHTVDTVGGVFECALMLALLFKGPLEMKHFEDNEANAVLWWSLVAFWVPFGILFYADGFVR